MPSSPRRLAFDAVRFGLVGGGLLFVVGSVHALVTIPPPPPDSEGFATGMAYLVGGGILLVSLGVAAFGIVLPAVVGADDPLGFNSYQRGILKVAGVILVGGFLANVLVALAVGLETGLVFWFGTVLLGSLGAGIAAIWRLGEGVRDQLLRFGYRDT